MRSIVYREIRELRDTLTQSDTVKMRLLLFLNVSINVPCMSKVN